MNKTLIASVSLLALSLSLPLAAHAEGTGVESGGGKPPATAPAGGMNDSGATSGSTESGTQARPGAVNRQDRKFVEDAAIGGMAEVQMGQLAEQRAQDPGVKGYGKAMVADHTPANQRLLTIAATLGITPPDKLDFMHRHTAKKLDKADPGDFDEDYIDSEVKEHKKMAKLMEDEMKDGQNPDLKQFATDMLPRVRQHQEMAEQIQQQLKEKQKR